MKSWKELPLRQRLEAASLFNELVVGTAEAVIELAEKHPAHLPAAERVRKAYERLRALYGDDWPEGD